MLITDILAYEFLTEIIIHDKNVVIVVESTLK